MKLHIAYGTPGKTNFIEDAETVVIYVDGDENIEVIVKGPNPIVLAELIVRAVNDDNDRRQIRGPQRSSDEAV